MKRAPGLPCKGNKEREAGKTVLPLRGEEPSRAGEGGTEGREDSV